MRTKTGDLNVIPKQVGVLRNLVYLAAEKLLLKIEARSPGQVAADLKVFTHALAHHIGRRDAFSRFGVMGATGCVNVMIAGPPPQLRRIYPSLDLERSGLGLALDCEGSFFHH